MRPAPIAVLLLLAACASPESGPADTGAIPPAAADGAGASPTSASTKIELRTDRTAYSSGDRLTLTLVNSTTDTYAFNPCTRMVERESNGAWTTVREDDRMCTMEAWLLDPNATRSGDTELPSGLEPGRYRVAVSLSRQGGSPADAAGTETGREVAISPPFTVGR